MVTSGRRLASVLFLLLVNGLQAFGQNVPCWSRSRLDSLAVAATGQIDSVFNNDQSIMAWGLPDYLRAVSRDVSTSGDPQAYARIRRYLSRIVNATDRARGVKDFTGESRVVWGTFRNSTDSTKRIVLLVETARLASALVEGAQALTKRFGPDTLTRKAVATAKAALRSYDGEWREAGDSLGWYVEPDGMTVQYAGVGKPWPVNMEALAGLALWEVGTANGDSLLLRRARMIYRAVVRTVLGSVRQDGHWDYWADAPASYPHHPDDVGHASFTAEFLAFGRIFEPSRWGEVKAVVERNFANFYPDSLESTERIGTRFAGRMGTDLRRWVEWAPLSTHVRRVVLSFAGSPALWPNPETYLFCSSIAYFHIEPEQRQP